MVGAVGIENNNVRNPKDLRGMARNAKSMKRNNEACKGILPQSSLAFPLGLRFSLSASSSTICNKCRLRAQDSRHGWQAGKLHMKLGKRLFYHSTTPARCLIALANRLGV